MMRPSSLLLVGLALSGCASRSASAPAAPAPAAAPAAPAAPSLEPLGGSALLAGSVADFTRTCTEELARARARIAELRGARGPAALEAYDAALVSTSRMANASSVAREVHPDAGMRDAARACEQQVAQLDVEVAQDRAVYDALSSVDLAQADAPTRYWLERALTDFRRAGVDRDEATRARVKALNEELVRTAQAFSRNISGDTRSVQLDPRELAGLPADYVKAHPVKDGKVTVTSNSPDYFPFMTYAKDARAREKVWRMYRQRAHPQNAEVLATLVARRHELATLLGHATWADSVTQTKMAATRAGAQAFVDQVREATRARAAKEAAQLLALKRKDVPRAAALEPWDYDYYEDRLKAASFGFDSQAVRPYFEYGRVKAGVIDVAQRLFGVEFRRAEGAPVWHADVEAYDVLEGGKPLGRVFLDMHPREDKYKHAAQFDLVGGQGGRRLPEAALVCNFPRPGELMTHDEVETFFHEFGHLVHAIFQGHQRWVGVTGLREYDFIETPSMLLQEWASEPEVLALFARHHATGAPLPEAAVRQLRASKEFGKGLWSRRQAFLADASLAYFSRAPGFDFERVLVEVQGRYAPFKEEWRPGTHFHLAFGHLTEYSAAYYTYLWSLVIAKDFKTAFEEAGVLDPGVARRYRREVLDVGGSRPAAESVRAFLGRDFRFDAYRAYLERDEQPAR